MLSKVREKDKPKDMLLRVIRTAEILAQGYDESTTPAENATDATDTDTNPAQKTQN